MDAWCVRLDATLPWIGKRVFIRQIESDEDLSCICAWRADPRVMRFMGGPIVSTVEDFRRAMGRGTDDVRIYIVCTTEKDRIGFAGFVAAEKTLGPDMANPFIGLSAESQAKGYGLECLTLLRDAWLDKLGYCKFATTVQPENRAAKSILTKAGFVERETRAKDDVFGFPLDVFEFHSPPRSHPIR